MLVIVFGAAMARPALHSTTLRIDSFWQHLSAGSWMLQHHAIPRNGILSVHSDLPWIDTSWGFDVLVAVAYRAFALTVVPILGMLLYLALAVLTFVLAGGRRNFWLSALLAAAVPWILKDFVPLPMSVSVLLFGVELLLLLQWRRSGDVRILYGLPILFALWCNLDIFFVLGLAALVLFCVCDAVQQYFEKRAAGIGARSLVALCGFAGLSGFATLLNPYGIHLAPQILTAEYSAPAFKYFEEWKPLAFRQPQDYALALLLMGAFFALGRRHSRNVFNFTLLALTACLGFPIQRDSWCIVIAAVAIIGDAFVSAAPEPLTSPSRWQPFAVALATLLVFCGLLAKAPRTAQMNAELNHAMPVRACDYIRQNRLSNPLFNGFEWGGFLTWCLPEYPVALDGRMNLYGDDLAGEYFATLYGARRLEDEPLFADAQTILVAKGSALERALTDLPNLRERYREVYSDEVAAVLVKN